MTISLAINSTIFPYYVDIISTNITLEKNIIPFVSY